MHVCIFVCLCVYYLEHTNTQMFAWLFSIYKILLRLIFKMNDDILKLAEIDFQNE